MINLTSTGNNCAIVQKLASISYGKLLLNCPPYHELQSNPSIISDDNPTADNTANVITNNRNNSISSVTFCAYKKHKLFVFFLIDRKFEQVKCLGLKNKKNVFDVLSCSNCDCF